MTASWQNQVALVTGGARGIGRATVRRLAAAGCAVAINYTTRPDAAEEHADTANEVCCDAEEQDFLEAESKDGAGQDRIARGSAHSQPILRPRFCSSSHFCNGLKYSTIARVERSSPVASRRTVRQSRVPPDSSILRRKSPTSRLPA